MVRKIKKGYWKAVCGFSAWNVHIFVIVFNYRILMSVHFSPESRTEFERHLDMETNATESQSTGCKPTGLGVLHKYFKRRHLLLHPSKQ